MSGLIPENQTSAEEAQAQTQVNVASSAASWHQEIKAAKKQLENFHKQGDEVYDRFLDKRSSGDEEVTKYNLFSVNTEILQSTLYAKFPEPMVTRIWEDQDDDVSRVAANILERNLKVRERDDFDSSMKLAIVDRLVPGIGQVWFRYDPTIVSEPVPGQPDMLTGQMGPPPLGPDGKPQMMDRVVHEDVVTDYIHWKDFLWSPCRVWKECRWVARACKMNKKDVEARFGPDIAALLKYKKGTVGDAEQLNENSEENANQEVLYATVYEIWCKRSRKVYWVSDGHEYILDTRDPPFQLPNFWPCPQPLFALQGTATTVPRSDYLMIQDQYKDLDQINNRISYLQKAVKVVGVYDKTQKELGRILTANMDNQMVAADNFAQFSEKGGMKGMIDWMPLADIVNAIERLRTYRTDIIQQIYELSGISDIMRGATKASETLGAQELKAQYGGVRLQMKQMQVALFVEEALEIKAIIMCKMFQPETLLTRSNVQMTPDAQFAQPAVELLKQQLAMFKIKVHADSMAVPEFNAERDARMAYLRMVAEFMTGMAPLIQQEPGAAPFLLQMLQWCAASFRSGRTIEGVLDQAVNAARQKLANPPPPPPPDPLKMSQAGNYKAQAMLNTAKAVGQTIENKFNAENPEEAFAPPPPPAKPPTH
jgi:hypothetical protein